MQRASRPGLFAGFRAVVGGIAFVISTPAAWPWALVPILLFLFLSGAGAWAAIAFVQPWLERILPEAETGFWSYSAEVLSWLGTLLSVLVAVLAAFGISPTLAGPALDHLASLQEKALGVPAHRPIGFLREIWAGFRAEFLAILVGSPIVFLLWVAAAIFPPFAPVAIPLKFLVVSAMLAWSLFDYPLTLRGVPLKRRFQILNEYGLAALAFGASISVLFWVPCFGLIMLPAGVAAATRLLWAIRAHDPDAIPGYSEERE